MLSTFSTMLEQLLYPIAVNHMAINLLCSACAEGSAKLGIV